VSDESDAAATPLLRVVHGGEPTAEEIAALVAAIQLRRAGAEAATTASRSRWASRKNRLRAPLATGPGAWMTSARRAR
jgi:protein involved in temperature-dependent protein secretion